MKQSRLLPSLCLLLATTPITKAFTTKPLKSTRILPWGTTTKKWQSTSNDASTIIVEGEEEEQIAIRVPLRYIGPYPCLALRFPELSTESQKERNVTGVSLDFVLDTGANTNTINAQVSQELGLENVGQALPGVGAAGALDGGDTYMLGECELEGLLTKEGEKDEFTFMTGLTASALPVASPAAAGLLGVYFFNAFEGGVEFTWGRQLTVEDTVNPVPPSVTFYGTEKSAESIIEGMTRVPITPLVGTYLPIVTIQINGVSLPALLDTGSPITVLNQEAAKLAGVKTVRDKEEKSGNNPFAKFTQNLKTAQEVARGDVLVVAGGTGDRVELVKSMEPVGVSLGNSDDVVDFGKGNLYVGDLPGLKALENFIPDSDDASSSSAAPPAVMLGMDVLQTRPRMLYRANEVFF